MDIVTEGYLEEFVQNFSINTIDTTRQFEYFANFIVVSNHFDANRFQLNDISTGYNAPGIDGIAIIVNNRLCTSVPKIVVYEYDDYDFPMSQIFPTKSMVDKARKSMYD